MAFVEASTPEFEKVVNYPIGEGQFITERHVAARDMVVVLGSDVVEELFGDANADVVGENVKLNGRQFTIIGVLEKKGGQMMGVSMDSIVVVPITTYHARLFPGRTVRGEDAIQQLAVQIEDTEAADIVSADITDLMIQRHGVTEEGINAYMSVPLGIALLLLLLLLLLFCHLPK